jgi:hypothetical protein
VINDNRLMLGDSGKMRLGVDSFSVNIVRLEGKKIQVIKLRPREARMW